MSAQPQSDDSDADRDWSHAQAESDFQFPPLHPDASSGGELDSPPVDVESTGRAGIVGSEVRPRDRLLWAWPLVLIVAMAVVGQLLGSFGVLLAGVATTGVLALFIGVGFLATRTLLTVLLVTCVAVTGVWWSYTSGFLPSKAFSSVGSRSYTTTNGSLSLDELKAGQARGRTFTGLFLDGLELSNAKLEGIVAHGASLRRTVLDGARLSGADLQGVDLAGAQLRKADLRGAILTGANLTRVDLSGACLRGADLSGALLAGANLQDAAVSDVKVNAVARAEAFGWPATDSLPCS